VPSLPVALVSASEMTCIVSSGALNSTHSLTRARGDGRVALVALVATCCVALALQHAHCATQHAATFTFLYQNARAR